MYSIYSEMQRLLPPSVSPSPSPEIEDDPPTPRGSNEKEKEAPVPDMKSAKHHPPGLLNSGRTDEGYIKGISKPALQTRSASSSSREQIYSRPIIPTDILHGIVSSMARVESDRDIGATNDVFMDDLDAMLRF